MTKEYKLFTDTEFEGQMQKLYQARITLYSSREAGASAPTPTELKLALKVISEVTDNQVIEQLDDLMQRKAYPKDKSNLF